MGRTAGDIALFRTGDHTGTVLEGGCPFGNYTASDGHLPECAFLGRMVLDRAIILCKWHGCLDRVRHNGDGGNARAVLVGRYRCVLSHRPIERPVAGYSTASAMGGVLIALWLGTRIKERVGAEAGFTASDFALQRYGRLMHILVVCISCFYMYIYIVAELTSLGNVYATLVGKSVEGNDSKSYTTRIAVVLAVLTWTYTAVAGLPASIFTDKFQGIVIASVVTMLLIATTSLKRNELTRDEFDDATGWFSKGFEALVTLWIAIPSAELFNQGTWQRVWASRSDRDMRTGFMVGAVLVTLVMLFFGVMGMIAYANDREAYDSFEKLAFLSFFDLLLPLPRFWHFVTLALLTTLAASSVDTLQNGLASVLSRDLIRHNLSANWSRLVIVVLNFAAVIQASDRFEVIPLFLVADLVCATSVGPLFAGLIDKDIPLFGGLYIPAPTELGAFLGCLAGMATVMVNGDINDVKKAENPYTGKVYARGPIFSYFWLTNTKSDGTPYDCSLCGTKTMVTFIVVPLISTFCCFLFSALDLYVGGNKAREPFIIIPRIDGDDAVHLISDKAISTDVVYEGSEKAEAKFDIDAQHEL